MKEFSIGRIWMRADAIVNDVPCKVVLYEADMNGNVIIKVTPGNPNDYNNSRIFSELSSQVMGWAKAKREARPVLEKAVEAVSSE